MMWNCNRVESLSSLLRNSRLKRLRRKRMLILMRWWKHSKLIRINLMLMMTSSSLKTIPFAAKNYRQKCLSNLSSKRYKILRTMALPRKLLEILRVTHLMHLMSCWTGKGKVKMKHKKSKLIKWLLTEPCIFSMRLSLRTTKSIKCSSSFIGAEQSWISL